jgi:hypothetical protein
MTMKSSHLLPAISLALLVCSHAPLQAAGAAAAAAAANAEKELAQARDAAPVTPYVLKNRSSFDNPGETARVPFWPVGWTKQKGMVAAVKAAAEPKITLDEKGFKVSSILLGSGTTPSLAVINGRAYSEGELIRMPRGSAPIRIRVQRINDGSVLLEHDSEKLVVSLRRPELNQHKDDELLDPNR